MNYDIRNKKWNAILLTKRMLLYILTECLFCIRNATSRPNSRNNSTISNPGIRYTLLQLMYNEPSWLSVGSYFRYLIRGHRG